MSFPTDIKTKVLAGAKLGTNPHSSLHNDLEDELIAVQTKVGIDSSTDIDSLDYKVSHIDMSPITTHIADTSNPHTVTATQVGLGSVDNTSDATKNSASVTLTNKTLSTGSTIDANVTVTTVLSKVYPIGCIYTSVVSTNPNTVFGFGTWSSIGAGKMLIGLDATDATMDTVEEVGGSKTTTIAETNLPAHVHTVNPPNTTSGNGSSTTITTGSRDMRAYDGGTNYTGVRPDGYSSQGNVNLTGPTHTHDVDIAQFNSGSVGSGTAITTISPFYVVWFFKRTA